MTTKPTFSIITPTYNRARLLPRVFAGLARQTCRDFEWIVVDDGSIDETPELVAKLAHQPHPPVRYFYQKNSGKHVALNRGVATARGTFVGIMDSDDYYKPHALERFLFRWNEIPKPERSRFVGVTALVEDTGGHVVGSKYPTEVFDSDPITSTYRHRVVGDKLGFQRTDVLRAFPFPENLGKFVPEGLIWNRIARHYRTRYVNEVWATVEYQKDGLTAASLPLSLACPEPIVLALQELLDCGVLPLRAKILAAANLYRFALHKAQSVNLSCIPITAAPAAIPLALMLFARDRVLLRKRSRPYPEGHPTC